MLEQAKAKFPVGIQELEVGGKCIYATYLFQIDLTPGMVLAEEVTAKDDLPPFRASVMVIEIVSYF